MHRIDTTGSVSGHWAMGTPGVSPATVLGDAWPEAVQEELIAILTAAGIIPVKGDHDQVLAAIQALITSAAANKAIPLRVTYWLSGYEGGYVQPGTYPYIGSANEFPDGSTKTMGGYALVSNNTKTYQLHIRGRMSTSVASKAVRVRAIARALQAGEAIADASADFDATVTVSTRDDQKEFDITSTSWQITPAMLHTAPQRVWVAMERQGGDAADTHTGSLYELDAWFEEV